MKKKILIIIFIILLIVLIALGIIRKTPKTNENTNSNDLASEDDIVIPDDVPPVNVNGENSGIYVGLTDQGRNNYTFISIKIDKETSKEEQVKSLISEISSATGYKIDINSVEIDENKIKVDFAKTAAPFEIEQSYTESENLKYNILLKESVAKTIFDSLNKTLKSYFGNSTEVYFSSDSQNINLENDVFKLNIDINKPYQSQQDEEQTEEQNNNQNENKTEEQNNNQNENKTEEQNNN